MSRTRSEVLEAGRYFRGDEMKKVFGEDQKRIEHALAVPDADRLVNITDDFPGASEDKLQKIIDNKFKTHEGYSIAKKLLLKAEQ